MIALYIFNIIVIYCNIIVRFVVMYKYNLLNKLYLKISIQ